MSKSIRLRWSGPAAVLGGGLWIAAVVALAALPEGCVGDACALPGRAMRDTSAVAPLAAAALLLIAVGMAALVRRARRAGRFGTGGVVGVASGAAGVALLATGGVVQALVFGGDFPSMPLFVLPGVLGLIAGVLLLSISLLRAGALPRWAGALLAAGGLALLGFNDQNAQALLAVPFGAAWVAIGYVLAVPGSGRER
jgi:hypothetical protein